MKPFDRYSLAAVHDVNRDKVRLLGWEPTWTPCLSFHMQ